MLKIENTEVMGWEHAIRGMRNPKNSWEKSDSGVCATHGPAHCADCVYTDCHADDVEIGTKYILGGDDLTLMTTLRNAGTDHRKFMRMITVYLDIIAPAVIILKLTRSVAENSCRSKIYSIIFQKEKIG